MYVISVIQKNGNNAFFKPCGVGWKNKDGSINFKLDVHGDVQFHIREKKKSDAAEPEKTK